MTARLEIVMGPMFADKTTFMLGQLSKYCDLNYKCLYINHQLDDRKTKNTISQAISTHSSMRKELSDKITVEKTSSLASVNVDAFQCIVVDEAHFFEDLEVVNSWIDDKNKHVICGFLTGDAKREAFGNTLNLLIPRAEEIHHLKAHCMLCINEAKEKGLNTHFKTFSAPFTHLLHEKDTSAGAGKQIDVGGGEKYISVCRNHYSELDRKNRNNSKGDKACKDGKNISVAVDVGV